MARLNKTLCLAGIICQSVLIGFITRYSRVRRLRQKQLYLTSVAVVLAEIFKLIASIVFLWIEKKYNVDLALKEFITGFRDMLLFLKIGVPGILYTIQNNLLYVAFSNLSPAIVLPTYQLKILFTVVVSILLLKTVVSLSRWISIILLVVGVILLQIQSLPENVDGSGYVTGNPVLGLVAIIASCFTSGFAGVYLEKLFKEASVSLWVSNSQLACHGFCFGLAVAFLTDGDKILNYGLLQGFDSVTWTVVLLNSIGGLLIACIMKYCDNISKCFSTGCALLISCVCSYIFFHDFQISVYFVIGMCFIIFSSFAYGINLDIVGIWGSVKDKYMYNFGRKFYYGLAEINQNIEVINPKYTNLPFHNTAP